MSRRKIKQIKNLEPFIDNLNIIEDPLFLRSHKGKWNKFFNNSNPIILEIGMGKGAFLKHLINYHESLEKSYNYLGLEIKKERVYQAYKKNKHSIGAGFLKLIIAKAEDIKDFLGEDEVYEIYLNFSDPWPKKRHSKHRLTSDKFLEIYKKILKKSGSLFLKTDNENLYNFTLENLHKHNWKVLEKSTDLHNEDFLIKNFVTEFESRWIESGRKIYYLKAQPN